MLNKLRLTGYYIKIDNLPEFNIDEHIKIILRLIAYFLAQDIKHKQLINAVKRKMNN
jgi:hypothetical protein